MRVIGTPRSGTNLVKHLVGEYLRLPVTFDQRFWKHGVFPALMTGRVLDYGDLPIIVVSKDPISQVLSWFRLARHVTLISGSARLRPFITGPMELTQDYTTTGSIRYRFGRPAHYWNQFYFAAASLQRTGVPVHFVNYEQVVVSPACAVQSIACFLSLPPPTDCAVTLPVEKLDASNDTHEKVSTVRDDRAFDVERAGLAAAVARMGWRNARTILDDIDDDVLVATGRRNFLARCQSVVGVLARLRSVMEL